MEYLEDGVLCFTKVTKHNNIDLNHKMVEDKDGEEDAKEASTNSDEEIRKKKAQ